MLSDIASMPPAEQVPILRDRTHQFFLKGRYNEAELCITALLKLEPANAGLYANLGFILNKQGKFLAAIASWEKAVSLNAGLWTNVRQELLDAWRKVAFAFFRKKEFEPCYSFFTKLISQLPEDPDLHNNLGVICNMLGYSDESYGHFQKALSLKPDNPQFHWNYARSLLKSGELAAGFSEFRWRAGIPYLGPYANWMFYGPAWRGENMPGKRLLVHSEQGFGDILQFLRYLPMAKDRVGELVFSTHPSLIPLLKNSPWIDSLIPRSEETCNAVHADATALLLDLPYLFGTTLDTIPANVPYVFPAPETVSVWKRRLGPAKRRVGLVWGGNIKDFPERSCGLQTYAPFANLPDITFYSLQKGPFAAEAANPPSGLNFIDYTAEIHDFGDTAAIISLLDLVITIDTSVAHLAGALGKPVWVMLPYIGCWRWLRNRDDSPWYPSVRLFRQPKPDDWTPVIETIARELTLTPGQVSVDSGMI